MQNNTILGTETVVVTATFTEAMQATPTFSLSGSSISNVDMESTTSSSVWTYTIDFNSLSLGEGTYSGTVSGSDSSGNAYADSDTVDFIIDQTAPTVTFEDSDSDNLLDGTETVIVTATFSEKMQNTPSLTLVGGSVYDQPMTATSSQSVWTYSIDFSGLSLADGSYNVTVTGDDYAGNAYAGTDSFTLTVDTTGPNISNYRISTSNATDSFAKLSDTVTLTFDVSETVSGVTVDDVQFALTNASTDTTLYANATAISFTGTGTVHAGFVLTETNTNYAGYNVQWKVNPSGFEDLNGNLASGLNTNTFIDSNSDQIIYDNKAPTLTSVVILSDNSDASKAGDGNIISINISGSENIKTQTSSVTILGNDASSVNLRPSNPPGASIDWQLQSRAVLASDPAGVITFSIDFVDDAGNVGTQVVSTTDASQVEIDRTPPNTTSVRMYSDNASTTLAKVGDIVNLRFTLTEAVSSFAISIASSSTVNSVTSLSPTEAIFHYRMQSSDTEGYVPFTIDLTDFANNTTTGINTVTTGTAVYFDKTAPTVTLTDSDTDDTLGPSDSVVVTATFNEAMQATPTLSLSGSLITAAEMSATASSAVWIYTINASTLGAIDGDYEVTVAGSDNAGNPYSGTDSITFTIDTIGPTVTITDSDADNILMAGDSAVVTATFNEAMDNPNITYTNGSTTVTTTMTATSDPAIWYYNFDTSGLGSTESDFTLTITGNDTEGNALTGSASITFTVDTVAPTVTLTDTDADNILGSSTTVTITATFSEDMAATPTITIGDHVSNVAMTLTSSSVWTYYLDMSSWSGSGTSAVVTVSGTDTSGNAYAGTDSITFTIDQIAPTVTLSDTDADNLLGSTTTLTLTATFSEAMSTAPTITIGNGVTNTAMTSTSSSVWTYYLDMSGWGGSGASAVATVSGTDIAGNAYTGTDSITFTIDTTAPNINKATSSITATTTYGTGQTFDIILEYDEPVYLTLGTASPTFLIQNIEIPPTYTNITYSSGSGTTSLTFEYTVQAGDDNSRASAEVWMQNGDSMNLYGGSLTDAAGK